MDSWYLQLDDVDEPAYFPGSYASGQGPGRWKLKKMLFGLVLPEYASAPAFYFLGKGGFFVTASVFQVAFMAASSCFQWWVFMDHRRQGSLVRMPERFQGHVETIMGVPVSCLKIPRWAFQFVAQMPNYIHVQQTAVVAGSAWATWTPLLAQEFSRRWQVVPLIGEEAGALGLPGLLTTALIVSCVSHISAALWSLSELLCCFALDEGADAANLLFLGF